MPSPAAIASIARPALTQVADWVAAPVLSDHLTSVQQRLDDVEQDRLEQMSMAHVVDEFWPHADGWRVLSMEAGFYYVTSVVEHHDHGVGISLIGAAPVTSAYSRGSVETWTALRLYDRRVHVRGSMHAQASNRMALIAALNARYEAAKAWTIGTRALAYAVVSSPALMDPAAQLVAGLCGGALVAEAEEFRAYAAGHDVALPPLPVRSYV